MTEREIISWCKSNGWTEPRQLEIGIWVAFPPGGVIETPLPSQVQKPKARILQNVVDLAIVAIATFAMLVITIAISPLFIKPLIRRYQNHRQQKNRDNSISTKRVINTV